MVYRVLALRHGVAVAAVGGEVGVVLVLARVLGAAPVVDVWWWWWGGGGLISERQDRSSGGIVMIESLYQRGSSSHRPKVASRNTYVHEEHVLQVVREALCCQNIHVSVSK